MNGNKKTSPTPPALSVIIPAYNEGANIEALLKTLSPSKESIPIEVIVVCNGCSDDTFERASKYHHFADVYNIKKPSKIEALNYGDSRASTYPRVYLDADVEISRDDLLRFACEFSDSGLPAGGVNIDFVLEGRPILVKLFYRAWEALPYLSSDRRSVGSGLYALAQSGRDRFEHFPQLIADDGFVDSLFQKNEKFRSPNVAIRVHAPRNLPSLIMIKSRAYAGTEELRKFQVDSGLPFQQSDYGVSKLLREKPQLSGAIMVYILVRLLARFHANLFRASGKDFWLRDESTRK